MANCTIDDMTSTQLREYVLSKRMGFTKEEINTPEKLDKVFRLTKEIIKTAEVEVEVLGKKIRVALHLTEGDKIARYVDAVTGKLVLDKRVTDAVQEKFLRKKIGGAEITKQKETVIKAGVGTRVHKAMENLINYIIHTKPSEYVEIISANPATSAEDIQKILKENDLNRDSGNALYKGALEIYNQIIAKQKKIDPEGKVRIYPEQIVMDLGASVSEGGTIDLLAVYSNMEASIFDYKTMSPKTKEHLDSNTGQVNNDNWIPTYKYDDFDIQLTRLAKILTERYGIKGIVSNRIVPIQVKLGYDIKEKTTTDKVVNLWMGGENEFLSQIAVRESSTGIKELDKRIESLYSIFHNLVTESEEKSSPELRDRIARKRKVLSKLIVKQDINYMLEDIKNLAVRYYNVLTNKENTRDELINGKPNPKYISSIELKELREELEVYQGILNNSKVFIAELGLKDSDVVEYNDMRLRLLGAVGEMIPAITQEGINRSWNTEELAAVKDAKPLNLIDRHIRTLGEQNHPAFVKAKEYISRAFDKVRRGEQVLELTIKNLTKSLEEWGARNGVSGIDVFKKLIGENNLVHSKHSGVFFKDLDEAQKAKNKVWVDKHLVLQEGAEEKLEKSYQNFLHNRNMIPESLTKANREAIKTWKANHTLEALKFSPEWFHYYNIADVVEDKYYSEGYKYMKQAGNEALLEFWIYYTHKMAEYRSMLGVKYGVVPNNFIPWIRSDIINNLLQGGYTFESIRDNMESMFKIKGDTQVFGSTIKGKIDPVTGEALPELPVWYTNPFTDSNGEINQGLKSIDLGKSLFIFGSMALNYNHMKNDVEPHIEALRDIISIEGVKDLNESGGEKRSKVSGFASTLKGEKTDHVKLFDNLIKAHVYGVRMQDKNTKTAQFLLGAARFQQMKELSLAFLTWVGNFAQTTTGSYTEGVKGYYYDKKQWKKAVGMLGTDVYRAATYIFEVSSDRKFVKSKNLSASKVSKILSTDTLFYGFRKASELVSNQVLMSMLQNYGLDAQGNIRRLANLPDGTKSLLEMAEIKNDIFTIKGLINEDGSITDKYTEFRNMVVNVASRVTGDMNQEDVNDANLHIVTNLMMRFKNWMPKMLNERFGGIRYNPLTKSIEEGRYWALKTNLTKEEGSWAKFVVTEVVPEMSKFLFHITTFGGYKYKVNEFRAKIMLEEFKAQFPNDAKVQAMTLKDFMDYKQGQISASATELRVIFTLLAILGGLRGDWDDDGEPDYKETLGGRTMFRMLNRMRMEIAFFINTDDWYRLFRFPVPIIGLADDFILWVKNTKDEAGDWIYGEEKEREYLAKRLFGANKEGKRDKKPIGYESIQWIPGYKAIRMFEPFKQHEELEY
jgi:hypothetical protein